MQRASSVSLPLGLLALGLAGCLAVPRDHSVNDPPGPLRPPTAPVREPALANGPALLLDDIVLQDEQCVLERLQDTLADFKAAKDANEELSARLRATSQRSVALEADVADLRNQLAQSAQELKLRGESLDKLQADLHAAQATIRELRPQAKQATEASAELKKLAALVEKATAENGRLSDQLLQAELARVKAQQDLIALQIVMARQQALLKRRPSPKEASAPSAPSRRHEEATP